MAKKSPNTIYNPIKPRTNPASSRIAIIENMYRNILTEWCISRFDWQGLPDSIDKRFIEKELFHHGVVLFYFDEEYYRFMAVRTTNIGPNNMYDNPTMFRTMDMPTYNGKEVSPKNGIPIWGSHLRIPAHDIVTIYAHKFAELDVSLEAVSRAMRVNRLAIADESQRLTVTNALRQIDSGQPAIFIDAGFDITEAIQALELGVHPDIIDRLRLEKNQAWNECMTLLGITSSNQDKKERLVAAEATGAQGQVLAARNSAMSPRQDACDQINRIHNLDVSVSWNLLQTAIPDLSLNLLGGNNGNVYN